MKLSNGVEQGVFVMLMLALSKDHQPVRSDVLSRILDVSDSYLKKILRKLVAAGLIDSSAAPGGGFALARPIEAVTLADVLAVFEEAPSAKQSEAFAYRVFLSCKQTEASVERVDATLQAGWRAFLSELAQLTLSDLLIRGNYREGVVDWNQVVREGREAAMAGLDLAERNA